LAFVPGRFITLETSPMLILGHHSSINNLKTLAHMPYACSWLEHFDNNRRAYPDIASQGDSVWFSSGGIGSQDLRISNIFVCLHIYLMTLGPFQMFCILFTEHVTSLFTDFLNLKLIFNKFILLIQALWSWKIGNWRPISAMVFCTKNCTGFNFGSPIAWKYIKS